MEVFICALENNHLPNQLCKAVGVVYRVTGGLYHVEALLWSVYAGLAVFIAVFYITDEFIYSGVTGLLIMAIILGLSSGSIVADFFRKPIEKLWKSKKHINPLLAFLFTKNEFRMSEKFNPLLAVPLAVFVPFYGIPCFFILPYLVFTIPVKAVYAIVKNDRHCEKKGVVVLSSLGLMLGTAIVTGIILFIKMDAEYGIF